MNKKKYLKISFLIQLFRVLRLIDKNGRYKLISLLGLVIFQAFFDVISLASLTPLIQIQEYYLDENYQADMFLRPSFHLSQELRHGWRETWYYHEMSLSTLLILFK